MLGRGEEPLFPPTPHSCRPQSSRGRLCILLFFPLSFVCNFLGAHHIIWGRPGRRGKGSSQRAAVRGLQTGNGQYGFFAMIYLPRSHANND